MIKKTVIAMIIILALTSIYSGAYKPLAKAQMYIKAQSGVPTYRTMEQLVTEFDKMFNFRSPIGQEEVIKFTNSNFGTLIMNENQSEIASLSLVQYVEDKIFEDNVVQLLQLAGMYGTLHSRFGRQEYLNKTEEYYKKVREIGPKLPHALYGLFNLYKRSGQTEKMKEIGGKILELWPSDEKVKQAVEEGF